MRSRASQHLRGQGKGREMAAAQGRFRIVIQYPASYKCGPFKDQNR